MRSTNTLLYLFALVIIIQSCGINNRTKAKNLREEIASEQQQTKGLLKKRNTEFKKLKVVKDSVNRYHEMLNITRP